VILVRNRIDPKCDHDALILFDRVTIIHFDFIYRLQNAGSRGYARRGLSSHVTVLAISAGKSPSFRQDTRDHGIIGQIVEVDKNRFIMKRLTNVF